MANSRRIEKFSALIKREISELLMNGVRDERIHQSMITITAVEVSGDLQHCKIFFSLFGEDKDSDAILACLDDAKGFLRGELARRLQMRRAPDIVFKVDRGIIKGTSVLNILDELEAERKAKDHSVENLSLDKE